MDLELEKQLYVRCANLTHAVQGLTAENAQLKKDLQECSARLEAFRAAAPHSSSAPYSATSE